MTAAALSSPRPGQVNRMILTATVALGAGAVLALAALALTLEDPQRRLASLVFGVCLLLCACCSYLYNLIETRWRGVLRLLDHGAIFLLIAGTYTPFIGTGIEGPLGFGMLEWIWGLALVGIAMKLLAGRRGDRLFVVFYLALGWLFLSALPAFIALNPLSALILLLAGGIAYTLGAAIYFRGIGVWTDAVWHGCVFLGSLCHLLAVVALRLAPASV
jgi:hemolysin III